MNERIVVVPDLHGSPDWKKITGASSSIDLVLFLGDYVDSFNYSAGEQLENLLEVMAFKEENPERVILLLGNHDIHYLPWIEKPYSGFQFSMASTFREIYLQAIQKGLVTMAYHHDQLLFTHAGVTKTWCRKYNVDMKNPVEDINKLPSENPSALGFINGGDFPDPYGDNVYQSPTWVRPKSLVQDGLDGFWQIVGHTVHEKIQIRERGMDKFFFCDTLLHSCEYITFEEGKNFTKHML